MAKSEDPSSRLTGQRHVVRVLLPNPECAACGGRGKLVFYARGRNDPPGNRIEPCEHCYSHEPPKELPG